MLQNLTSMYMNYFRELIWIMEKPNLLRHRESSCTRIRLPGTVPLLFSGWWKCEANEKVPYSDALIRDKVMKANIADLASLIRLLPSHRTTWVVSQLTSDSTKLLYSISNWLALIKFPFNSLHHLLGNSVCAFAHKQTLGFRTSSSKTLLFMDTWSSHGWTTGCSGVGIHGRWRSFKFKALIMSGYRCSLRKSWSKTW